jgi:hypothetical protein
MGMSMPSHSDRPVNRVKPSPLGTALIQEIIKEYRKAKAEKNINSRIFRGTSRTIASTAEDFFAKYLDKLLTDYELTIWVDPQIVCDAQTVNTDGKTKSILFRPDICVLNSNNEVCLIFELKMDFGRNEDLAESALQRKKELALITRAGTAHAKINGREEQITLPKSLVLNYVIFADNNLPDAKRTAIKINFNKNKAGNLYVLTAGDYLSKAEGKHNINPDFNVLETMALEIISSKTKTKTNKEKKR